MLFGGAIPQAEARIEVLLVISSLVRHMGWIVDYHVKHLIPKGHHHVVSNYRRPMSNRYVEPHNFSLSPAPEPPSVNCGVQYSLWLAVRIEVKHAFQ